MTTAHRFGEDTVSLAKEAPDVLIARCSQMLKGKLHCSAERAMKLRILSDNRLAEKALRVVAVA